jgi:hypothetical protein
MNKDEAREYTHDCITVDKAIRDESKNEYNDPDKGWPIPSDQTCHDHEVYKSAWGESRNHSR